MARAPSGFASLTNKSINGRSRYRVWQLKWLSGEDPESQKPRLVWGGKDGGTLDELCARYPRTKQYDDLSPFSCGDFYAKAWIEKKTGDGNWEPVAKDPRF